MSRQHSEETRAKMRASHWSRGDKAAETGAKIAAAMKSDWAAGRRVGRPMSPETRLKQRVAKRMDGPITYRGYHRRVEAERGKPLYCSHCDRTDTGVRYEWANLTGHYDDVNDYIRLCKPCHGTFDFLGTRLECADCGSTRPRIRRKA